MPLLTRAAMRFGTNGSRARLAENMMKASVRRLAWVIHAMFSC